MALNSSNSSSNRECRIYSDLRSLLTLRHRARDLKLFSRQPARSLLFGETRSRFRGRGMEFEEVRRYQPGDDIRTIDWRVSARTGKPHTKLFCEERERPVHILVDQRSTMFFGSSVSFKSVVAAELAASLAWAALAGSDRIGGQIVSDTSESDIRARRNKQAVLAFIHDLNDANHSLPGHEQPSMTLAHMIEGCRRVTRPGTAIFIISDFHDIEDYAEAELAKLGRHTDITLMRVQDPLEIQLPNIAELAISDGKRRTSIAISSDVATGYQNKLRERESRLKHATIKSRATFLDISTTDSTMTLLQRRYGK